MKQVKARLFQRRGQRAGWLNLLVETDGIEQIRKHKNQTVLLATQGSRGTWEDQIRLGKDEQRISVLGPGLPPDLSIQLCPEVRGGCRVKMPGPKRWSRLRSVNTEALQHPHALADALQRAWSHGRMQRAIAQGLARQQRSAWQHNQTSEKEAGDGVGLKPLKQGDDVTSHWPRRRRSRHSTVER